MHCSGSTVSTFAPACVNPSHLPPPPQHERAAAAAREGGLSSYRQQMSFGVHVLAMMAAFYAFGHAAGMGITSNKTAVSAQQPRNIRGRATGWAAGKVECSARHLVVRLAR